MDNFHHLTLFCADKRCGLVAITESVARLASEFLHLLFTVKRVRIHSDEGAHAVATVDVKHLCDVAKSVCGIHVATEFLVIT